MVEVANVELKEKCQVKNQILSSGIIDIKDTTVISESDTKDDLKKMAKSNKKRKTIVKTVIISIVIISVIIMGLIITNYIYVNSEIYDLSKVEASKVINIKTYINNVTLQEKVVQAVKHSNKELQVEYNGNIIKIPSNKVSKDLKLGINIKNGKNNIPEFKNTKYLYIENAEYSSITIKLPKYLKDRKIVDIYTVKENNNIEIYKNSVPINANGTITIESVEGVKGYAVIYIPLKDIIVDNTEEKVSINQNTLTEIKFKFVPENATCTQMKYIIKENSIIKADKNKLVGLKNGEENVKVTNENNEIEKEITINVTVTPSGENPTEPTYVNGILIANKSYKLPETYNPGLQPETLSAFNTMKAEAAKQGVKLWITSDYRSYKMQSELYRDYVKTRGKDEADNCSARPGYSEHQTGLAIDVNTAGDEFANTVESNWLAQNAHKYGFIIRYPYGKEDITGYKYEPWHVRYLGKETAEEVYNSGLCLEEYLGITSQY